MKNICVYLGSNPGKDKDIQRSVIALGQEIAKHNLTLVYGGSSNGLMGILAKTVLEHEGRVIGITTKAILAQEEPLTDISEFIVTETMQERKRLLQERADAFVVIPGGLGTLEEVFETWNAMKLGLFTKPLAFLNVNDYYEGLFTFIKHCMAEGFIDKSTLPEPIMASTAEEVITRLLAPTRSATPTTLSQ